MSTTNATTTAPPPAGPAPAQGRRRGLDQGGGGLFAVPYLIAFVLFMAAPILYGVYLAFTDESLAGTETRFVGFGNFAEALTDSEVWITLGHTLWFTLLTTVPLIVIPLAFAILVNAVLPGQWLWRLAFFTPYLLPVTVVALAWEWLYQPELGLLNGLLGAVGIEGPSWLNDEATAMIAIAITTVWWTLGFNFLLYIAALQDIPAHIYEAASIDGADGWRRLVSITLPMLSKTTGLVLILQLLASLKVFDQIYIMTYGGPAGSTRPILEYIYDTGFTNFRLGYAAAISYVFFALILIFALLQNRISARAARGDSK